MILRSGIKNRGMLFLEIISLVSPWVLGDVLLKVSVYDQLVYEILKILAAFNEMNHILVLVILLGRLSFSSIYFDPGRRLSEIMACDGLIYVCQGHSNGRQ